MILEVNKFSNKQINKIGKKFRDSIFDEKDVLFLDNYRKLYNEQIINYSHQISSKIKDELNKFVLVGRLKRIYSIIRKLQRKSNYGMDLTRMSDIAGIRVIVKNIEDQEKVLRIITQNFNPEKIYDYRKDERLYRSIHVIIKKNEKLIEVQVRTLAQQTWADESESFGEQAKYGKFNDDIGSYLKLLKNVTLDIDNSNKLQSINSDNRLFNLKSPIEGKYKRLSKFFDKITNAKIIIPIYYLVVFDSVDNTLVSEDVFSLKYTKEIFSLYKYKTEILDENRFEIIFFISTLGKEVLRISHPRFFICNQYI